MPKRQWYLWPSAFARELNSVSGAVGVVGVAISAITALAIPPLAPIILAAGGATVAGSLGWAALRSLPRLGESPSAVNGIRITLSRLQTISPPLKALGIVGTGLGGKSTLLDHIRLHTATDERTEAVYAVVVALPTAPASFAAVLDGAGDQFVQQFQVAELADVLAVVLDHNATGDLSLIDPNRLHDHEEFLVQLRSYLTNRPLGRKVHIHFILNKMDLWGQAAGHEDLVEWFNRQVEPWKTSNLAARVTSAVHSNQDSDAITRFVQAIVRSLANADE